MATYYVWSGATGAGTGADWTNAFTTIAAATAVATTANDIIKVNVTHTEMVITIAFGASVSLIVVDKDASDAYTPMTTGGLTLTGANNGALTGANFRVLVAGLRWISSASGTPRNFRLGNSDGMHTVFEDCRFGFSSTGASNTIRLGGEGDQQTFVSFRRCDFSFGAASQFLTCASKTELIGCTLSGTAPTTPLFNFSTTDPGGGDLTAIGCDFSAIGSTELVANSTTTAAIARFSQCKLGTSFVMLATQTNLNRSSAEVFAFDCASGDTHGLFAYANPMGSVVSDTGIYFTSGAAAQSWKIVTTANCSFYTPFETPWFGYWNTVTTAITPYVEILRDGSATAYQDDEVWLDVMAKTISGSTQSALTTDRMTLLGTPANQDAGAGLGSWTGESGTAWSGKLQVASLTPAEVGRLSARVVVGEPSVTVYADPQIRT